MENSLSMNGGDGPNSYSKNSMVQKLAIDQSKIFISESIEEVLQPGKDSEVFSIADLGCSVGPNTFLSVDTIIQAVQHKYKTRAPELNMPEFHVFFNDLVSNDFNTLFKTLPLDRKYIAAGVPGSFHGRLFPESSMNLMHSAYSLQWLTRVPKEVMKEDSPLWNEGRISYAMSSSQVVEAFKAQFFRDIEAFFEARPAELAPGGLLVISMPGRAGETQPSKAIGAHFFECLGDTLSDMAAEGLISKRLVDSFNIPVFFPTASEVKEAVSKFKHLSIEKDGNLCFPFCVDSQEHIQLSKVHVRAFLEVILSTHFGFGPELVDELFNRYPEKLEKLMKTRLSTDLERMSEVLLLVVRND
ncbi:hypothetical protein ACH5RR_036267 [Cinchona calisaya]|uniref:Uncharacterized protein n=1 Tax=Cinchona calisaya TaxID=153742 RepID=A0ABD2Y3X4_9GENT